MAPRTIIISAANERYWPLLSGLLNSIDGCRKAAPYDVGIFDLGLLPDELMCLRNYGVKLVTPSWDYDVSRFTVAAPPFFKAMTARPSLPSYFKDYDIYVWLDADCWVQDWRVVEMLILAAKDFSLSAVPEIDRSYNPCPRNVSSFEWNYKCISSCFGENIAEKWKYFPIINSGVFAAAANSEIWKVWPTYLAKALDTTRVPFFFAEQTAFNVAIREEKENLPIAFLPARFNWMCHRAMPRLSFDGKIFVEPNPPFEPIGIMHMAHIMKGALVDLYDLGGQLHSRRLAYPPLR